VKAKPTNEALRAWAADAVERLGLICDLKVSVPQWGTVQVTERAAFVEAIIEVPLREDGSIAD
jgi:hypothetical protein